MKAEIEILSSKPQFKSKYCVVQPDAMKMTDFGICMKADYITSSRVTIGVFHRNSQNSNPTFKDTIERPALTPQQANLMKNGYQGVCEGDSGGSWWLTTNTDQNEKAYAIAITSSGGEVCGYFNHYMIAHSLIDKSINRWIKTKAGLDTKTK